MHEIRRNCSQPVNTRETFLNKDRMVETRRILEARQCSEKSDGLAVGTTPGRTTKADVWMWRMNEEEGERERRRTKREDISREGGESAIPDSRTLK